MFGVCALATLGTASGSTVLASASGLLIVIMLFTSGQLHDVQRSPVRIWLVHGLTVAGLIWALSVARTARIDSVVVIIFLGIFNRFVLRQGLRDDLILLGGSAVLLAVSTTITPGLAFLPMFVGFVWLTYGALRSAQILGLAETEPPHRQESVRRALWRRSAPAGQSVLVWVAMAFIFVGYLGLTLFPKHRFANLLGAGAFMSLPGATDTMRLTNNGGSTASDATVVLRVKRALGGQASLQNLYARVYALDLFDGQQWTRALSPALFPLVPDDAPPVDPSSPGRVRLSMQRIERDGPTHPLVALGRVRPSRVLRLDHRARVSIDGTWHIAFPSTALSMSYRVDLDAPAPTPRLPSSAERALRQRWLSLPDTVSPRIRDLGVQLTRGSTTTEDKVGAVVGHFGTGYRYSLDPLPGTSEDPLTRFLFEARQGHCELYAGAVAVLLRSAGVPARVVTGYYGGWWNSTAQTLEFTENDAHAWVEAYDPTRGWIWVDATPPNLRARRRAKTWAVVRDIYDALEAWWFANVVDFDEEKRRALVGRLVPEDIFKPRSAGGLGFDLGLGGSRRSAAMAFVLLLAVGGGLLYAAGWLLIRNWRFELGARLRKALDPHADPSLPLGRLVADVPVAVRGQAETVVRAYEAWRFGPGRGASSRPPADLVADVAELKRTLSVARATAELRGRG